MSIPLPTTTTSIHHLTTLEVPPPHHPTHDPPGMSRRPRLRDRRVRLAPRLHWSASGPRMTLDGMTVWHRGCQLRMYIINRSRYPSAFAAPAGRRQVAAERARCTTCVSAGQRRSHLSVAPRNKTRDEDDRPSYPVPVPLRDLRPVPTICACSRAHYRSGARRLFSSFALGGSPQVRRSLAWRSVARWRVGGWLALGSAWDGRVTRYGMPLVRLPTATQTFGGPVFERGLQPVCAGPAEGGAGAVEGAAPSEAQAELTEHDHGDHVRGRCALLVRDHVEGDLGHDAVAPQRLVILEPPPDRRRGRLPSQLVQEDSHVWLVVT